jgi:hypothetical protein
MAQAIDWAEKHKADQKWAHLDTTRIAAGGQSCGGLEALVMATDTRVKTLGIFNSGSGIGKGGKQSSLPLPNNGKVPTGAQIKVPAFFFLGGPVDVATAKVRRFVGYQPCHILTYRRIIQTMRVCPLEYLVLQLTSIAAATPEHSTSSTLVRLAS